MSATSVLRHAGRQFRSDIGGVAGIEFAFVVSVLLMIMLGLCDIAPSWLAYTHVSTAASTAADLAGEFSQMQPSDMLNVYSAAADVMSPFSATNQSLRITNVFSDGNGNAKVYWSCGTGSLPPNIALSAVTTTPTGISYTSFLFLNNVYVGVQLNGTNTSYIVTEVRYTYTAPARFVLRYPQTMNAVSYYLPRISTYVGFPWDGSLNDAPPVPTATTQAESVQLSNGATCNYAK